MNHRARPGALLRLFFRFPVHLYGWGLGFLMGKRFLLLNHRGRRTGLPRQTVVEVVKHDRERDVFTIVSGYGTHSNWYHNLLAHPEIGIQHGSRRLEVKARPMSDDEGGEAMVEYARTYPSAARAFAKSLKSDVADGTEDGYRAMGRQELKFFELPPVQSS